MITSHPQRSTLISFILFLIISFILAGINIYVVLTEPAPQWFNYLIITLLIPVCLAVSVKILSRYKQVSVGNGQIEINYPQFRKRRIYPLKEVASWEESVIKTGKHSSYKELEIKFRDGRAIQMGYREFTEYSRILSYLSQKIPKVRITQGARI